MTEGYLQMPYVFLEASDMESSITALFSTNWQNQEQVKMEKIPKMILQIVTGRRPKNLEQSREIQREGCEIRHYETNNDYETNNVNNSGSICVCISSHIFHHG